MCKSGGRRAGRGGGGGGGGRGDYVSELSNSATAGLNLTVKINHTSELWNKPKEHLFCNDGLHLFRLISAA